MDADNLTAWFAKILLLGLLDGEGQQVVSALVRGDLEADNTASAVKLADDRERDGAGEDGHVGSVLGDQASQKTSVSEHDDQVNVQVLHSGDSGSGQGLRRAHWSWSEELDIVESAFVVDASLGFCADLTQEGDGLDGVLSV